MLFQISWLGGWFVPQKLLYICRISQYLTLQDTWDMQSFCENKVKPHHLEVVQREVDWETL